MTGSYRDKAMQQLAQAGWTPGAIDEWCDFYDLTGIDLRDLSPTVDIEEYLSTDESEE